MKRIILLITLLIACLATSSDPFRDEDYAAGLLELEPGDDIFYWLFRSRSNPKKDPLVVWLSGGPGCSSEIALFYENGPWTINEDLTLKRNDYSWNEISNFLYIDQPIGTGFSRTENPDHLAQSEEMVAETFYLFLTKFMTKFPEYKGRDFYITGESYAGHMIPAISSYIVEQNNPDINLISTAIGNGWVKPIVQYPAYQTYAAENNLIGPFHSIYLKVGFWICQNLIKFEFRKLAFKECNNILMSIVGEPDYRFNVYNINEECKYPPLCYDMSGVSKLFQQDNIKKILGVGDRKWTECNVNVQSKFFERDWNLDLSTKVRQTLEGGVGVFVYSGDLDFACNWRGGEAWTNEIFWEKQHLFQTAQYQTWRVDGEEAGEFKQIDNFTFLRVYEAGHMVPMDQPKRSLEMLKKFISHEF